MSETPTPDALYSNFANGRQYPFRKLPENEMMLMTDRRARQFVSRVLAALDPEQAQKATGDSDLSPIHFYDITQDLGLQGEHYSEYERPWEYDVFPAIKPSIVDRWEECIEASPENSTKLEGEHVADIINTVVLRKFNVPMEGIRTLLMVTSDNVAFQSLRDHFAQTVAPYNPTNEYANLIYGNIWQSIIADCMHRGDSASLLHILAEGKKLAPEALSDAIAHMIGGISGNITSVDRFEKSEVAILAQCMPYMIFSKENTTRSLHNVLRYGKMYDEYPLYDTALDLVIKNPELQTDDMSFGYEIDQWSFEEVSELITRLTQGGVPASYIIERVFIPLVDCRADVWEKIDTLLPVDMTERDHTVWNVFKDMRGISEQ